MGKTFNMEKAFHDFADFVCTIGKGEDEMEHIGTNRNYLPDSVMSFLRKIYCQELADRSNDNFIRIKHDTKLDLNSTKNVLEILCSFIETYREFTNYGRCIEVCVSDILQYHFGYSLSFRDKNISQYTGIHKDIKTLLVKLGQFTEKQICNSYFEEV